jgi:hypothetical protein
VLKASRSTSIIPKLLKPTPSVLLVWKEPLTLSVRITRRTILSNGCESTVQRSMSIGTETLSGGSCASAC